MAITYLKNAANLNVVVHADATGSIILTGNDSVSNIASPGETIIGSTIRQVWAGSNNLWTVSKGNSTVNAIIGHWDSTGWYDYAGNGCAINIEEGGENLYFTLGGGSGYIMLDIKKITGP